MSELYRDDYYIVRVDGGILRLERTATAYPTLAALDEANRALAAVVRGAGVKRILLDVRKGPPGRNDAAFEEAIGGWRRSLAAEAERAAVLVRTVAGKLQSQRLARADGRSPTNVFMDEAEALAYLKS